ncbi:MAG: hypothetical protein Ct9H300mP28_05220 [Pseudomonadota bacterium]|nr:MAG: hypothetical protein Ct9H300mP28_05220 [Pseudomonadota bacterium]
MLGEYGFEVLTLNEQQQQHLHNEALFNSVYGIKVQAHPVSVKARDALLEGVHTLEKQGAQGNNSWLY